jgi:putative hemolysin
VNHVANPFRLPLSPPWLAASIEYLLNLDRLALLYDQRPTGANADAMLDYTLQCLDVSLQVRHAERLEMVPVTGPLLVVANHPLGGLEGVALAKLLRQRRPDLMVLTNQLLCRIPELADIFIGVDVLSANAAKDNINSIKRLHSHLKAGGALLIFPAGTVASIEPSQGRIQDKPWNRLVGQLAKRHGCPCLPIWVGGRNSFWFYALGLLHPRLRTALLPRQLANKAGYTLDLVIGETVPAQELEACGTAHAVADYLRITTDALGTDTSRSGMEPRKGRQFAAEVAPDTLQQAIDGLAEFRLVEHRELDVYCAPHDRLGVVMDQIAVSREITFRSVGEGTGLAKDTDRFDDHYLHLFLWDKIDCRVAGAYRVGLVDRIVAKKGVRGLYSRSLYRYNREFIQRLGNAVEMGRSFIHPDYQRRPIALNLLWRGIGQFLVEHPHYHTLFGSVSISREYTDLARSLIADTLLTHYRAEDFQQLVQPLTPLRVRNRIWSLETLNALANIKLLSKLIGRCDPGKALPVLLRHYLSLNGRLVCFNIHSKFNDSLEGLIIVDLRLTDAKTAIRFMGEDGYNHFMSHHRLQHTA